MKLNSISLFALLFVLSIVSCSKDDPEIIKPKITDDKVVATATSASFTWTVDWTGKRISVVEVSEDVDMNDSRFYGSEEEIINGSFSTTANDLKPATKYYYRFWVWNQNYDNNRFVFEKKDFSTLSDLPMVKTLDVINITRTSATCQGEVVSDGGADITERGVCWGTEHNPTIVGNHESDEEGLGAYSFDINELIADETYYVRAYAKNEVGIAYGEEKSFTTGDAVLPTVITTDITNITWTTAKGGGEVLSDGDAEVTERGICWGTSHNPTISDNNAHSGSGIGEYVDNMNGLVAGTTYYVKAYAINRIGVGYGEEKSFSTSELELPTVITNPVIDITVTSAKCGGNVTCSGGSSIFENGVCWSMNHNPSTSNNHVAADIGSGSFTCSISELERNTTYYVRAYAINSVGTAYGTELSFTTLDPPPGALNGLFSVSATKQVYFSQGNLQFIGSANPSYWKFADNQWDYYGHNGQGSTAHNADRDLFGWGTSGYNHGAVCYRPWSTSTTYSDYFAYGNYNYNLFDQTGQADWGYNSISNGGNQPNQWRTPTYGEWSYLFNVRNTSSGIRYAKARVNGVDGVILIPDDWNVSIYNLNYPNLSYVDYSNNVISASQWNTFQNAGAVFLPEAGYRSGIEIGDSGGYYWSSTCDKRYEAYYLKFNSMDLHTDAYWFGYPGHSVRLVCDYEP